MPPGKLARYANSGEGSSSGGSCRPPLPSLPDRSSDDEDDAPLLRVSTGDYVHVEEATVIQQIAVISEAAARGSGERAPGHGVRGDVVGGVRPPSQGRGVALDKEYNYSSLHLRRAVLRLAVLRCA
jgi:hypothetical protein